MNKNLKDAILAQKRAYAREWRKKNPDKVKNHNDTYWQKKAEKALSETNK